MAKVKAPLLSYDARGNIKKTLIYSFAKGRNIVKYYFRSFDPRTIGQQAQRGLFSEGVTAWNGLSSEEKLSYNQFIRGDILTGFNAFMKEWLLYETVEKELRFGYLISLFFDIHTIMFNPAYRRRLLRNILINKNRGIA